MDNNFTQEEWGIVLELLGAQDVAPYKGGFRSSCPIHHGDGTKAFAVWMDESGTFRASCHSHQCVKASTLEWVVAKSKCWNLREAVSWLEQQLGRKLEIDLIQHREMHLVPSIKPDMSLCDLEHLERLRTAYPYHPYWADRGYSRELVQDYQLAYRSLDRHMVIPVFDDLNQFVGMMLRTLDPDDPIKYRWESPNPTKAAWLYGMPQALRRPQRVHGLRAVFVVEGTLDPLNASALGFPVVATQANRMSMDQVQQLITNWDLVFLIPDNDTPGQNLVKDAAKLLAPFVEVCVASLPPGVKDLDDFPKDRLAHFLNSTISDWSNRWHNAPRRTRGFLTLNPSVSLD